MSEASAELWPELLRTCTKCKAEYPPTPEYFNRRNERKSGLASHCKKCEHERVKAWRKANPEKYRAQDERQRGSEASRRAMRNYYYRNKEKSRERSRRRQKEKKEALREYKMQYFQSNRERFAAYCRNRYALKQQAEGTHTYGEIQQMYKDQGGLCAYCETDLGGYWHVDHMQPLTKGGRNDWTNLALTCPTCNMSKQALMPEEFMERRAKRGVG